MLGRALFSPHRRLWNPQTVRIWSHHLASLPNPSPSLEPDPSTSTAGSTNDDDVRDPAVTLSETKRLMRLINVEALKKKLGETGGEVIAYNELLRTCESMGVARSSDEAIAFARALDESGVVLLFRDKVYLHPDKVVDSVRRAVPFALAPENDPRKDELKQLVIKKEEIDKLAHKQVRRILWTGLAGFIAQVGLFFRLTFWEFSWDVMEPIAFFTTTIGLVVGYAYFLITSRDPTYQDFMERLFTTRQKKLMQKHGFNMERYLELQKCCKDPWEKICRENRHPGNDGSHSTYHDLSLHK